MDSDIWSKSKLNNSYEFYILCVWRKFDWRNLFYMLNKFYDELLNVLHLLHGFLKNAAFLK